MAEQDIKTIYEQTLAKMTDLTDRQKAVLRAALKLFAAQGFEATTTAQIAAEAGVASGSVYKHFNNKQGLLMAVLSPLFQGTLMTVADEFIDENFNDEYLSVEQFIKAIVTDRLYFISNNFQELKLLFGQVLANETFKSELIEFLKNQLNKSAVTEIKRMQAAGIMVDLPLDIIFQLLFGMAIGYFGKLIAGINLRSTDQEIELVNTLLIRALKK